MQTLKMDFQSQSAPPVVPVMQFDAQSRFIGITLYNGGVPYEAPEGASYTVQYCGPGANNMGWYDTIQLSSGTRKAVIVDSASKNVVTLELAEQALRVSGNVFVNLCVVTNTGYMLKTFPILCRVTGAAFPDTVAVQSFFYVTGITSEQWLAYVTACQDAQKRAEDAAATFETDPTLSLSGKAADAAKVGEAVGQLKEDIVSNEKRNLVNLGAQKVVKGSYYLDRGFSQTSYYTWYFDLAPFNTNRFIVTAASPGYTNFVTFLDESMKTVGYVENSSENVVVKSEMYVTKPENAKYIASTTDYLHPNSKALLVSACISVDEIQGAPLYTTDNGEDVGVYPIVVLKGTANNGKLDSSYIPNTTKRAALYCPKSNCDIKIKCVGKFSISYENVWTKEAMVHKEDTGRWILIQNDSNTDFEDIPTGEDIMMVALSEKLHDVVAKPYCIDITNKFTYNQASNSTIPFNPSNIRVVTSLFSPPQKETIMISVPGTIDVIVEEFILEDGVYSKKYMYKDFAANINVWLNGTFYCNVYPERYYTILIRNKDNSPISVGQVYKYLHVYKVDNRFHIPEYYRDYLSQKEKEVLENIASFNSFAFAFITDIHIQRNTKHSPALMRRIKTSCAIKTILGGGDWQTAWNSDEKGKNAIVDDMIELRDLFFDVPMLKTIGNHEWAYGGNNQYNISTDEAYNLYYRSDEEKAKSEIVYPENGNGTYFYSDDKTNKIRYISVNCMDYADNLDISKYNKEWYFSISEEQIAWLKSSLNLPSNDWLCVVFSHVPLWTSSERPFGTSTLVVNAEKIGKIISGYTSKTEEFSAHKGTLVCWLAGHTHRDALIEWHGTHMVVTNGDCFIREEGAQMRTLGTTSEQCFDIFCINKKERNVKIVRIGAGENRKFAY